MPADRVGSIFRERRERLGIPIDVAADATNIRARLLETLEGSDFGNYPPHGHAVGMLSSYARYLGLDPRPILERYEAEFASFEAGEEMATSAERTRKGLGRFGERTNAADKPLPRDAARKGGLLSRRSRHEEDDSASRLNAKLDNERIAEGDDRYKSGTVKVVGKRQTGSMPRVGSRRARSMAHAGAKDASGTASPRSSYRGREFSSASGSGAAARDARSRTAGRRADSSAASRSTAYGGTQARRTASRRLSAADAQSQRRTQVSPARQTVATSRTRGSYAEAARRARQHQQEEDGTASGGSTETLSFFGGVAVESDGSAETARRRPRTHRVSRTDPSQDSSSDDTLLARALGIVKSLFGESRTRLIALAFAVIVIGVVAAAAVLISTAGNANSGVLPVDGGAQDTSVTTQSPDAATTTVTTTNGSPVNVKISVAEGQTSLVSVTYDDDNAYSGTAVGPWERSFYVTDSLSASFGKASAVTVTENGNPVNFETKEDGSGSFNLVITTTTSSTETSTGNSGTQDGGSQGESGQ